MINKAAADFAAAVDSGRPASRYLAPVKVAGVVVPAHDEEQLLPACLAALRNAAGSVRIPVHLLVVADACTDETAAVAAACGAEGIQIRTRNVGAARAAGMAELLRRAEGTAGSCGPAMSLW